MPSANQHPCDYLPTELMKTLAAHGRGRHATGTPCAITFLYSEVAGNVGLAEDLAKMIFGTLSREIAAQSGTTEKFRHVLIGYWGALAPDPNHALNACRAALAGQGAIRAAGLTHTDGSALRVLMGIDSVRMMIDSKGTDARSDYEFMRDAAQAAAQFKSANQQYGTEVIIGDETRRLAGSQVHIRELDRVIVGKQSVELAIHELLAIARDGESPPKLGDSLWDGTCRVPDPELAIRDRFLQNAAHDKRWRPPRAVHDRSVPDPTWLHDYQLTGRSTRDELVPQR